MLTRLECFTFRAHEFKFSPQGLPADLNRHQRWILDRYVDTVEQTNMLLEKYEAGEAAKPYMNLSGEILWWFIELSKDAPIR